ncbi:hypothetical protein ACI65C_010080 [Semiaphis heraclei]
MVIVTSMYMAIGLSGFFDQQDQLIIGDSILNIRPIIRCRTVIKLCVAVNVLMFQREFNANFTPFCLEIIHYYKIIVIIQIDLSSEWITSILTSLLTTTLTVTTKLIFTHLTANIILESLIQKSYMEVMGLIGYLGNTCNIFIYPYIIELCVTHALHGMSTRPNVIAKDVCFVLLGLMVLACGTSALVIRIIYGKNV